MTIKTQCAQCGKALEIVRAEYNRRLKASRSKKLFCDIKCNAQSRSDYYARLNK